MNLGDMLRAPHMTKPIMPTQIRIWQLGPIAPYPDCGVDTRITPDSSKKIGRSAAMRRKWREAVTREEEEIEEREGQSKLDQMRP